MINVYLLLDFERIVLIFFSVNGLQEPADIIFV